MTETIKRILSALAAAGDGRVEGLPLDRGLYSQKSLEGAQEAFSAFCTFEIRAEMPRAVSLGLTVLPEHRQKSREVCGEVLNFLLEASVLEWLGAGGRRP